MIRILKTGQGTVRLFVYTDDALAGILNLPQEAAERLHAAMQPGDAVALLEECSALLSAPRDEFGYCECGSGDEEEHMPDCPSYRHREVKARIAREVARLRQREVNWYD